MSKQYFEKLDTEKLAELKKTNLKKFEFSVIDEMAKAEKNSKELVKKINTIMKGSAKLYKDMDKFAKQATKEVNAIEPDRVAMVESKERQFTSFHLRLKTK